MSEPAPAATVRALTQRRRRLLPRAAGALLLVLAALTAALADQDGDIAGTSASLLAGEESLPTEQGVQAAVRAFSYSGSRGAGVRVMRRLLANTSSREAALAALTAGLADQEANVSATCRNLLDGEPTT